MSPKELQNRPQVYPSLESAIVTEWEYFNLLDPHPANLRMYQLVQGIVANALNDHSVNSVMTALKKAQATPIEILQYLVESYCEETEEDELDPKLEKQLNRFVIFMNNDDTWRLM